MVHSFPDFLFIVAVVELKANGVDAEKPHKTCAKVANRAEHHSNGVTNKIQSHKGD